MKAMKLEDGVLQVGDVPLPEPAADVPANLVSAALSGRRGRCCAQRNTLEPPTVRHDRTSNAEKENFLLKLCTQIA